MRLVARRPPRLVPVLAKALFRALLGSRARNVTDRDVLRAIVWARSGSNADAVWNDPERKERLGSAPTLRWPPACSASRRSLSASCSSGAFDRTDARAGAPRGVRGPEGGFAPPTRVRPGGLVEWFHDFSSPFRTCRRVRCATWRRKRVPTCATRRSCSERCYKDLGAPMVPLLDMNPLRQAWYFRDMSTWAEERGLPFRFPSQFPLRTVDRAAGRDRRPGNDRRHLPSCMGRGFATSARRRVRARVLSDAGFDGCEPARRHAGSRDQGSPCAPTPSTHATAACAASRTSSSTARSCSGARIGWGRSAHALAGWRAP
jgi:2-hydroxychromene-2-carboxylate isomerase